MSESARPFDDSLGDASSEAPYADSAFGLFLSQFGDFVIPETNTVTTPLSVIPGAVGEVQILAGKAVVNGSLYVNDAPVTKSLDAAANNRIDRIILREDAANQTIRLTVLKGVEAANPSQPNLSATDAPLAQVWLSAGFNPAADVIGAEDIRDERQFFPTGEHENQAGSSNLMHNSEFLAYSQPAAGNVAPEGWRLDDLGAPTSVTGVAPLNNQPRGRTIRIQNAPATDRGIQTQVRVGIGWYNLRGTVNVTSGVGLVMMGFGTVGATQTIAFRRTGANTIYVIRGYSAVQQDLTIRLTTNAGDVSFGQVILTRGFVPGVLRHKHELIMLDTALTDAAWTATAKSTAATLIDLNASFGAIFGAEQPIRGLILRLRGNDSASSGGNDVAKIYTSLDGTTTPLSILRLGRVPNDKIRDTVAFSPIIGGLGNTFYLGVVATGAGTLDATVEIIGIIT